MFNDILDFLTRYEVAYILCILAFIYALFTQFKVKSTFKKYSKINSQRGVQAHEIARQILDSNGLYDVSVIQTNGDLTDHYDPRTNVVALSQTVYNSTSVAAIGVASHEVGHAIQHATNYTPIKIRSAILPIAQFGSQAWFWLFVLGLVLSIPFLIEFGIGLFICIVIFQLVTLPVEFNASNRAMKTINDQFILQGDELTGAKRTLRAAAMTYVASLAVSLAQLLRLLARSRR